MTTTTSGERARRAASTNSGKSKDTKKAQLIRLLSARGGAGAVAISGKLGWQPHTTRAAITGLKKAGYEVTTEKPDPDKLMRYRITASPKVADAAESSLEPAHAG